jgi:hypothetical protein
MRFANSLRDLRQGQESRAAQSPDPFPDCVHSVAYCRVLKVSHDPSVETKWNLCYTTRELGTATAGRHSDVPRGMLRQSAVTNRCRTNQTDHRNLGDVATNGAASVKGVIRPRRGQRKFKWVQTPTAANF